MIIRSAKLSDSERVSELMLELGYDASESLIKDKLIEILKSDIDEVYVSEIDSVVLGFISCHLTQLFHKKGRAGRITSLVVSNTVRGLGVGKKLVEKADEYFQINDCSKAEVTSGDHRPEAHQFYEAQGYKLDERRFIKYYN
ncbi:MAG: GNAT family N-acetyltransferase [Deltaproteobacteria bacterium]|nr:GNAT family N-acetyltransferase [Deltaproteobacteria bacterium]